MEGKGKETKTKKNARTLGSLGADVARERANESANDRERAGLAIAFIKWTNIGSGRYLNRISRYIIAGNAIPELFMRNMSGYLIARSFVRSRRIPFPLPALFPRARAMKVVVAVAIKFKF